MNLSHIRAVRIARFAALAALFSGALGAIQPATAQSTATPAPAPAAAPAAGNQVPILLGILDTQAILNVSNAGKSLNTQWDSAMKALNDDMDKKEAGLRTQAQQLEVQRQANPPTITPADYAAKRKALETQDIQFQQAYGKNKQALEARLNKAREAITNAAKKALQDEVKARNLTLVIDRSAAPLFSPLWDITGPVMQRLNKALPNVKL